MYLNYRTYIEAIMKHEEKNHFLNIGYFAILSLIFITLKLCHVIAWSWFWVLSPLIIPVVILLAVVAFLFIIVCLK